MPNKLLYIWLIVVSVAISMSALLITPSSPWFTLISSIGCGGIASVVVAGLIEYSNWKAYNKRVEEKRNVLLQGFYSVFVSGIDSFIQLSFEEKLIDNGLEEKKWLEWIDLSFSGLSCNYERIEKFISAAQVLIDRIEEQAKLLNEQNSTLLEQQIIGSDDLKCLSGIGQWYRWIKLNKEREWEKSIKDIRSAEDYLKHFKLLHGILEKAPAFKDINEKRVGSIFYKMLSDQGLDLSDLAE